MEYILSKKYDTPELQALIMGPNPVKLEEELLLSWTPEQLDYIHDADYWRDSEPEHGDGASGAARDGVERRGVGGLAAAG